MSISLAKVSSGSISPFGSLEWADERFPRFMLYVTDPYLYALLPYDVGYHPYSVTHVLTQLQLLFYSALAFTFLKLTHIYPPEDTGFAFADICYLLRRLGFAEELAVATMSSEERGSESTSR